MKQFLSNRWFKFISVGLIYTLWVIWLGNFWWLLGLTIIFDIYISQKVNWSFWKKKNPPGGKQTKIVEWVDAIVFAVIAATFIRMFFIESYTIPTPSMEKSMLVGDYLFVSKTSYGPKTPYTPLSFPFVHNKLPLTDHTKSYVEWVKRPYNRIAGLSKIKNNDIVVYHFPEGDTVATKMSTQSYHLLVRNYGRSMVWSDKKNFGDIIVHPADKRENYIKRCVGIPGDIVEIKNSELFINGKKQSVFEGMQYNYVVETNGTSINPKAMERLNISLADRHQSGNRYMIPLTEENAVKLKTFSNVISVKKLIEDSGNWDKNIFPSDERYQWNGDNFGPVKIPVRGETINLTMNNLPLYKRIIDIYEGNDLEINGTSIIINGKVASSYTFKMDYYWMMGDNRHNSADSRYWGFLPEDHVVGKALFIWLSLDEDKGFPSNIRWKRLMTSVH
ncbi:MAG: S26 family signal peptidase [Mariniphaga sp.]|nr:S26 family signal peptidase [Mariniphaga sp.]